MIQYDTPIEVTKNQYNTLMSKFAGIVAGREEADVAVHRDQALGVRDQRVEPPQQPGQELVGQGPHKPDGESAQFSALDAPRLFARLLQLGKDGLHSLGVGPPGVGERHTPPCPPEQGDAQFLLQLTDMPR